MAVMWQRKDKEVVRGWLNILKAEGRGLTAWEVKFCREFRENLDRYPNYKWSQGQEDKLEQIYTERTPL